MAFKFKDLMVSVTAGGGGDTPICTVDTVEPKPEAQAATCTVDTVYRAAEAGTCTVDTVDRAFQAGTCTVDTVDAAAHWAITCTVDTVYRPPYGLRLQTDGTGICTVDTVRPATLALMTTVTTVTTLAAAAAGPGATSLAQLKSQLQSALADVERREREQQEAQALPKTVEEADDLERRLEGALQELRDHRKTLGKGAKKESSKARKPRK